MSSSSSQRMIHQDYIARIRYSNALPPPPNPPKLLDIPNTGLASGQYTTPGFASRLARDQPLNIEADAELGMPLDLVGMPGIFDGDESSIQASLHPPPPHSHDRPLLRPLSTLGKPKFSDSGVSFLRRTEYISAYTSKSRFDSTTSKSLIDSTGNRPRRPVAAQSLDKESPEAIKNQVQGSFQIAANNLKNRLQVRHPAKRNVKLLDAYPLLPDHETITDAGGYITVKFLTNPVPPSSTYDVRLENSILKPIERSEAEEAAYQAALEAYERDPERNPAPENSIEYELLMTQTVTDALNFKRKFDALDPEKDSDDLYTSVDGSGNPCIKFHKVRSYESATYTGHGLDKYEEEVVIAIHDGSDGLHQKAAYYYPLIQRTSIRPQRRRNINRKKARYTNVEEEEKEEVDIMEMRVLDPDENMQRERDVFRDLPFGKEDAGEDEDEDVAETQDNTAKPGEQDDEDDDLKSD